MNLMDGYKTYIGGALIFIAAGLTAVDSLVSAMDLGQVAEVILYLGAALGFVGTRHAIAKGGKG